MHCAFSDKNEKWSLSLPEESAGIGVAACGRRTEDNGGKARPAGRCVQGSPDSGYSPRLGLKQQRLQRPRALTDPARARGAAREAERGEERGEERLRSGGGRGGTQPLPPPAGARGAATARTTAPSGPFAHPARAHGAGPAALRRCRRRWVGGGKGASAVARRRREGGKS